MQAQALTRFSVGRIFAAGLVAGMVVTGAATTLAITATDGDTRSSGDSQAVARPKAYYVEQVDEGRLAGGIPISAGDLKAHHVDGAGEGLLRPDAVGRQGATSLDREHSLEWQRFVASNLLPGDEYRSVTEPAANTYERMLLLEQNLYLPTGTDASETMDLPDNLGLPR